MFLSGVQDLKILEWNKGKKTPMEITAYKLSMETDIPQLRVSGNFA